jgi:hypothetical protein
MQAGLDLLDFVPLLDRPLGFYKRYRRRRVFKDLDAAIDHLVDTGRSKKRCGRLSR